MTEHKALRWANKHIVNLGFEPLDELPLGAKKSSVGCPLARAFRSKGLASWVSETDAMIEGRYFSLPPDVRHFVVSFDRGNIPGLDLAKQYPCVPEPVEPAELELQAA